MQRFSIFGFTPYVFLSLFVISFLLVSFAYAQWEPDVRLSFDGARSMTEFGRSIAAGPGEVVHVVWADERHGGDLATEIYYRRSTDQGATWEPEFRFSYGINISEAPSISTFDSIVHVVWYDWRNFQAEIFYRRSTNAGATWGPEIILVSNNAQMGSTSPSVWAVDSMVHIAFGDGRFFPPYKEIYYKRSMDQGITWESEVRLTYGGTRSGAPDIFARDTMVHLVWFDTQDYVWGMTYYNRSTDQGTTWGSGFQVNNDTFPCWSPRVCASGSNVHVVWTDERHNPNQYKYDVYYRRSIDEGVTWGTEIRLTNTSATTWVLGSVRASGPNVHIVWTDPRDGNDEIYYRRSTDMGETWEPDIRLTNDPAASHSPHIAFRDTMVYVVWTDKRDGNSEIYYKRNPTGNVGVQESEIKGQVARLKAMPNPFVSFATIPGHEQKRFVLYDISGRSIGTYSGRQVGEDISPGVYFIRALDKNSEFLKIVKMK